MFAVDPRKLLVNRTLAATANDHRARREWIEYAYPRSGLLTYLEFPRLMGASLAVDACQQRQVEC